MLIQAYLGNLATKILEIIIKKMKVQLVFSKNLKQMDLKYYYIQVIQMLKYHMQRLCNISDKLDGNKQNIKLHFQMIDIH